CGIHWGSKGDCPMPFKWSSWRLAACGILFLGSAAVSAGMLVASNRSEDLSDIQAARAANAKSLDDIEAILGRPADATLSIEQWLTETTRDSSILSELQTLGDIKV